MSVECIVDCWFCFFPPRYDTTSSPRLALAHRLLYSSVQRPMTAAASSAATATSPAATPSATSSATSSAIPAATPAPASPASDSPRRRTGGRSARSGGEQGAARTLPPRPPPQASQTIGTSSSRVLPRPRQMPARPQTSTVRCARRGRTWPRSSTAGPALLLTWPAPCVFFSPGRQGAEDAPPTATPGGQLPSLSCAAPRPAFPAATRSKAHAFCAHNVR